MTLVSKSVFATHHVEFDRRFGVPHAHEVWPRGAALVLLHDDDEAFGEKAGHDVAHDFAIRNHRDIDIERDPRLNPTRAVCVLPGSN